MTLLPIIKNKVDLGDLKIIGVTGTSGKTSVLDIVRHNLSEQEIKTGAISSLGYSFDGKSYNDEIDLLNMKASELNDLLSQMKQKGITHVVLEMHPENIEAGKFKNLNLDSGVITNTFEDPDSKINNWDTYVQNKLKFIKMLSNNALLVLNSDDQRFLAWLNLYNNEIKNHIYTFMSSRALAQNANHFLDGVIFNLGNDTVRVKSPGPFTISNTVQGFKLSERYMPGSQVSKHISSYSVPTGRMEVLQVDPFVIIVDYAYTPENVEASLAHISSIKPLQSNIITVLGSVGEMYKSRRRMGEVACKYSSMLVLGAQDPGFENVSDINTEIAKYAESKNGMIVERLESHEEYEMIDKERLGKRIQRAKDYKDIPIMCFDANNYTSRFDAIDFAIKNAKPKDIVYITGKGHETSLYFGSAEYEWSDSEAVKVILKKNLLT